MVVDADAAVAVGDGADAAVAVCVGALPRGVWKSEVSYPSSQPHSFFSSSDASDRSNPAPLSVHGSLNNNPTQAPLARPPLGFPSCIFQ